MEAPPHQSPVPLPPPQLFADEEAPAIGAALLRQAAAARAMMAAATGAQQQQTLTPLPAAAMGREQCPRCASRDTKFCYYNNYNTAQPRHFCRACRRYWTLGGSLRNVPFGGSTRKRPRPARPTSSASSSPVAAPASLGLPLSPAAAALQAGGLLGSLLLGSASALTLLALGAAPLLEGQLGPGLGQPALLAGGAGDQLARLGFGGAGQVLWPGPALRGGERGELPGPPTPRGPTSYM